MSGTRLATSLETVLPASPFAGYLAHKEEIDRAMQRVLHGGKYILGEEVAAFEREFAQYIGTTDAVGLASGTDALLIALRACGVNPGDAVITVSHTAVATVCAIQLAGASPLLVDVDPVSFVMDMNLVEETLKKRVKAPIRALVPVHLYGQPADMTAVMEIAKRFDLVVVEDCAQAHGATWDGQRVGSFGHAAAFSFYPTKNLGALGDGGALVTNDATVAERARMLRQYGWKQRYVSEIQGTNSRLDEMQAAILRVKLEHLDQGNFRRREIAELYRRRLSDCQFVLPCEQPRSQHVFHQYVLRTSHRDELKTFIRRHFVETAILYPVPVHLQNAYRDHLAVGSGGLRHTETLCQEILSLPMYPELPDDQIRHVTEVLHRWPGKATLG